MRSGTVGDYYRMLPPSPTHYTLTVSAPGYDPMVWLPLIPHVTLLMSTVENGAGVGRPAHDAAGL